MWHKKLIIINVFLLFTIVLKGIQFPDYFILQKTSILNHYIASEGRVWDTQTRKVILSVKYNTSLALNSIFYSDGTNTFLHSNEDGHFIAQIPGANYTYSLIGNYLWTYLDNKFVAYKEDGRNLTNLRLSAGIIFPYLDEIRYVRENSIYKYQFSDSNEQLVGSFEGNFKSWFLDGEYFITIQNTIVRLYDKNATLIKLIDMPTVENVGGTGSYIWAWSENTLYLYRTNSETHTTYSVYLKKVFPKWNTIGILPYGDATFSIIELTDSEPNISNRKGAGSYLSNYDADIEGNWTTTSGGGVVNYSSFSGQPTNLNFGMIRSLIGNPNGFCALATASGHVLVYHLNGEAIDQTDTVVVNSSKVMLSMDGKYLFCGGNTSEAQYSESDLSLYLFEIPSHSLLKKWPHDYFHNDQTDYLFDFNSSNNGLMVSQKTGFWNGSIWKYYNYISDVTSGDSIFLNNDNNDSAPQISPTNKYVAISRDNATKLYRNGILINAFDGRFVGWINDNLFIVFDSSKQISVVYSSEGESVNNYTLPSYINHLVMISDTELYVNNSKVINIKSGKTLFNFDTIPDISTPVGSNYILYKKNNTLRLKDWRHLTGTDGTPPDSNNLNLISLGQNYPNPFNSGTSFTYSVPSGNIGILSIFSTNGDVVLRETITGNGIFTWNPPYKTNGIYIYQLSSSHQVLSRKMLIIRNFRK